MAEKKLLKGSALRARARRVGLPKPPPSATQSSTPETKPQTGRGGLTRRQNDPRRTKWEPKPQRTIAQKAGRAFGQAKHAVKRAAQQGGQETKRQIGAAGRQAAKDIRAFSKAVAPAAKAAGVVGRVAAPVVEGVRVARYLTDEGYRKQAEEDFENMSEKNAFLRAVEGGLGGTTTIAAAAANLIQAAQARGRARAGEAAADAKTRELIARGILDESGRPIPLEQRRERIAATSPMGPPAPQQKETPAPQQKETPAPQQKETPAPQQKETPAPQQEEMEKLYKTTMGGSFDPNSPASLEKMKKLQDFYTTSGGMGGRTPTRFALDYYKTLK
jgi:hypothetical protein